MRSQRGLCSVATASTPSLCKRCIRCCNRPRPSCKPRRQCCTSASLSLGPARKPSPSCRPLVLRQAGGALREGHQTPEANPAHLVRTWLGRTALGCRAASLPSAHLKMTTGHRLLGRCIGCPCPATRRAQIKMATGHRRSRRCAGHLGRRAERQIRPPPRRAHLKIVNGHRLLDRCAAHHRFPPRRRNRPIHRRMASAYRCPLPRGPTRPLPSRPC